MDDEIEIFSFKIKVALAFAILRLKPCHLTALDFVRALKLRFCANRDKLREKCRDMEMELAFYKSSDLCSQTDDLFQGIHIHNDTLHPTFRPNGSSESRGSLRTTSHLPYEGDDANYGCDQSVKRSTIVSDLTELISRIDHVINYLPHNHNLSARLRQTLWTDIECAWKYVCERLGCHVTDNTTKRRRSRDIGSYYEPEVDYPPDPKIYSSNRRSTKGSVASGSSCMHKLVKIMDRYGRYLKMGSGRNKDDLPSIPRERPSTKDRRNGGAGSERFLDSEHDFMDLNYNLCWQVRTLKIESIRALCESLRDNLSEIDSLAQIIKSRIVVFFSRHTSEDLTADLDITFYTLNLLLSFLHADCDHLKALHENHIKCKYINSQNSNKNSLDHNRNVDECEFNFLPPPILIYNIYYFLYCIKFILWTFVFNYDEGDILPEWLMDSDNNINLSELHEIIKPAQNLISCGNVRATLGNEDYTKMHAFLRNFRFKLDTCSSNLSDKYPLIFYKIFELIQIITDDLM